jgi:hypothetical protein
MAQHGKPSAGLTQTQQQDISGSAKSFVISGNNLIITKNNDTTETVDLSKFATGIIDGGVNTFTDLPDASANTGKYYIVNTTTGVIGINRKKSGIYRSDGTNWKRLSENQLKVNDSDKLNGISGSLYLLKADEKFTDMLKSKLDGIEAGATVNDTDVNLKDRANHTGTQTASTISDFDTEVSNNTTVVNKVDKNTDITGATKTKITYDTKGLVITGADLVESDIPTLSQSKITNLTTDLSNKSDNTHNHNLNNLTEKSYNSLTDKPDLSDLHSHANKAVLDATTASFTTADETKLDSIDMNTKVDKVASTDNVIVRFNGTGGAIQDSNATIEDSGKLNIIGTAVSGREDLFEAKLNEGFSKFGIGNFTSYSGVFIPMFYGFNNDDNRSGLAFAGLTSNDTTHPSVGIIDFNVAKISSDNTNPLNAVRSGMPDNSRLLSIRNNAQLKMTMMGNGNLGLGVATPTEKFEVNGKIKATSINFSGLPTSTAGLSSGDVWNDGGVLKIV